MERFETIIQKGKIIDSTARAYVWGVPIFLLLGSTAAAYEINFTSIPLGPGETDFYQNSTNFILTIFFLLVVLFSVYLLSRGEKILRITFCKDDRSGEDKEKVIKNLMLANGWKLIESDRNYYKFWENNIFPQSYDITIVFDEKGFYVNSYLFYYKVIDFGTGKKRSEEVCISIKSHR
ncbi:hypothetical protein FW778_22290 [Ginsengibacter hankyongi]|uniref:Uncharacterized protein n=1 Tax=Ginsengibacter hankyongi TaxID=2607284 RepID=A0A5J5I9W0_9BACT|nr:hypothetical protein [Ginsengibacter hankyongi]KAA9034569.1 hypothetical protein FW778_22290 [Ginsengibacter hankyongi]